MTTRLYVAVLVYIIIISWGPLIRRFSLSLSAVECNSPCVVLPTVVVFIDVGIVYYMYSSSSSSTNTRARELSHRMGSEVNPPHRIPLSLLVYTQPAGRSPPPPSPHPPPSPSSSKRDLETFFQTTFGSEPDPVVRALATGGGNGSVTDSAAGARVSRRAVHASPHSAAPVLTLTSRFCRRRFPYEITR